MYIRAMRLLAEKLPEIPLVAAFETGFHATVPIAAVLRGALRVGREVQIKRWGFHGASHRYIATRTAELLGRGRPAGHLVPPGRFEAACVRSAAGRAWRRRWA
jgi:acetate kinase